MVGTMFAHHVKTFIKRRPILSVATGVTSYAFALEEYSNQVQGRDASLILSRKYDSELIQKYWSNRPVTVLKRVLEILNETLPIAFSVFMDWDTLGNNHDLQHQYALKVKESLTKLGPAFVKVGQQISIRPDLAPPSVLSVLQTLCDAVEPVDDEVALTILREELLGTGQGSKSLDDIFENLKLVASASLGQVYKARIKESGKYVAIKVQRPDMVSRVSLDLFLLSIYAKMVDTFTSIFTEQVLYHEELIGNFARGSYEELDYEKEASNQQRFKIELAKRNCRVFIPNVHFGLTSQRILTSDWVDGVKLVDVPKEQIKGLIPIGVELFLTQLLDIGAFHADPHAANLYVSRDGTLCLLDFGLIAEVDEKAQHAMTAAIVHLLSGDFDSLIRYDAKKLGFLPEHYDTTDIQPVLTKILSNGLLSGGSNLRLRKQKLMEISNELNEVFFRYPFSVPPFFALITRGLGLLEGIALNGDPEFDIFQASYPYAKRRAREIFQL